MKKMLAAVSAASLFMFAGAASAQSIVGTPSTADGYFDVQQTLSSPVPCPFSLPFTISGGSGSTTTGATSGSPAFLCSLGAAGNVTITDDFEVDPIPLNYTQVLIKNITANAIGGTCGPVNIVADVVNAGPDLTVYIPWQSIPGVPVACWLGGYVVFPGVALV